MFKLLIAALVSIYSSAAVAQVRPSQPVAPINNPQFNGTVKTDTLQILGPGSTGDIPAMRAAPSGGVLRSFSERYDDCVNVKDRGAVADLVRDSAGNYASGTSNTAAFQAAINRAIALRKDVCVPAGSYYLPAGLMMDVTGLTRDRDPRPSIRGAGRGVTELFFGLGDINAISVTAAQSQAGPHVYSNISGLRIEKVDVKGSGLKLDKTAFLNVEDVNIIGFEYGVHGTDVLSTTFRNVNIGSNRLGARFVRGTFSYPNAISFIDSNVGGNFELGIYAENPTTLSFLGGQIAGNGYAPGPGTPTLGGVYIKGGPYEGGVGYVSNHVYYEGNRGFDVTLESNDRPVTHTFSANTFNRVSSTGFSTNNIRAVGSAPIKIDVRGNAFKRLNDYAANASRPYVDVSGATNAGSVLDFSDTNLMDDAAIEGANVAEWKPFNPAFAAVAGTLGSTAVNSARFRRKGKTVTFAIDVSTPSNGSGAGALQFTPPVPAKGGTTPVATAAMGHTGEAAFASYVGGIGVFYVYKFNGTYPGGDNARLIISGSYETE